MRISIDLGFGNRQGNVIEQYDDEYRIYMNDGALTDRVVTRIPVPTNTTETVATSESTDGAMIDENETDDTASDGGTPDLRCDGGAERSDRSPEARVERMPDVNPGGRPTTEFRNADTCPFSHKTVEIHAIHAAFPDTGNLIGHFATVCSEERTPKRFDGIDEDYEQREIVECPYCSEAIAICLVREALAD